MISALNLKFSVPPSVIKKLNSIHVKVDEPLSLIAKVDGHPVPECRWYLNDNLLAESELTKFEMKGNVCSLIIENCKLTDAGIYKLSACNVAGEASTEATIDILGNPDSPVVVFFI